MIPITNGYGYLDMAWDPQGNIWAGGGNGTLLVSTDGGKEWEKDPVGTATPSNFTRLCSSRAIRPLHWESEAPSCAGWADTL